MLLYKNGALEALFTRRIVNGRRPSSSPWNGKGSPHCHAGARGSPAHSSSLEGKPIRAGEKKQVGKAEPSSPTLEKPVEWESSGKAEPSSGAEPLGSRGLLEPALSSRLTGGEEAWQGEGELEKKHGREEARKEEAEGGARATGEGRA